MTWQELNELDLGSIGSWPRLAKMLLVGVLCALLGGAFYYYVIASSIEMLRTVQREEETLRVQFEGKAMLAASLPAYRVQMAELEKLVEAQLKQLPNTNEVAGMLDDISFIATDNGLQLNRINWEPEVAHEFSTELPMRIEVEGSYHQLGQFAAGLAGLPRIVILDTFQLKGEPGGEQIAMSMRAKTYRYNGDAGTKAPVGKKS